VESVVVGKLTSGSVGSLNNQSTKLLPVPNSETKKCAVTTEEPDPDGAGLLRRTRANA
jgi:hypothetical protein